MKNIIPLIVAVILGLAAVFAVSKILFSNEENQSENTVTVVVAAHDLDANDELQEGSLTYREIPESAAPKSALNWKNVGLAYGQRITHPIANNEYVLLTDISLQGTLADTCRAGEWTVPVTFSDPTLVKMLMPNDEIAILMTTSDKSASLPQTFADDTMQMPSTVNISEKRETSVLLPCVRVIGVDNGSGSFTEGGASSGTIYVSLPQHQAMTVIAAQREAELYPALRKRHDTAAINRTDGGVVNEKTFEKMRKNLVPVILPDQINSDEQP